MNRETRIRARCKLHVSSLAIKIQTIIYLNAEAWEEIYKKALKKSWKKLLSSIFHDLTRKSGSGKTKKSRKYEQQCWLVKIFQQLEGCKDMGESDIGPQILSSCDLGHHILSEDKIIEAYTSNPIQDSSNDNSVIEINIAPSYSSAYRCL